MKRSVLITAFALKKKARSLLQYLLCLLPLAGFAVGCAGPQWYIDPGFAERLAKQENKPILLYFKAWDSTQHRNMLTTVFNNAAVSKELRDTVNVELEFAWSAPYDARYKVHRSQVCVMCKPNGDMVDSALYVNPVPTPEQFLEWLKRAKTLAVPPQAPPTSAPSTTPTPPPTQGSTGAPGDAAKQAPSPAAEKPPAEGPKPQPDAAPPA